MRWKTGRRSKNVVDARGSTAKRGAAVGGGAIVMALIAVFLLGKDPGQVMSELARQQKSAPAQSGPVKSTPEEDQVVDFLSVVLGDTEDVWTQIFRESGARYEQPRLKIFRDAVQSACGYTTAAAGPFYCPGDNHLYMDLSFLNELKRMGAQGDFALAYVIAHEVGHHIQNLTGRAREVQMARQRSSEAQGNQMQVRMELEADCYAGVWAHHAHSQRQILEQGDIEEGLGAASSVGDDHLQKMAGRRVVPESFTHGTSQQRMSWFRRGLETGSVQACDTFSG